MPAKWKCPPLGKGESTAARNVLVTAINACIARQKRLVDSLAASEADLAAARSKIVAMEAEREADLAAARSKIVAMEAAAEAAPAAYAHRQSELEVAHQTEVERFTIALAQASEKIQEKQEAINHLLATMEQTKLAMQRKAAQSRAELMPAMVGMLVSELAPLAPPGSEAAEALELMETPAGSQAAAASALLRAAEDAGLLEERGAAAADGDD